MPLLGARSRRLVFVVALGALVALGAALRLPWLGSVPGVSHDEGNWLLASWQVYNGQRASLPPDASFVTLLFARLIALSWRLAGPGVATARAVLVVGALAGIVAVGALSAAQGRWRAGLAMGALLAVHPWAVLWSRTVTVPYALSLSFGVLAPLAFLHAWEGAPRRPWLARALTGQLFALGFHFTPLAVLPALACGLRALTTRARRDALRSPSSLAALALAAAHVLPIVRAAGAVASRGSTRPSHFVDHFGERLRCYLTTALEGLDGEAAVRDFTGLELQGFAALAALGLTLAWVALAWPAARPSARAHPPEALSSLGAWGLAVALLGLPLILAPVRQWHLPSVDSERYLFALVAPMALLLGGLAERPGRGWAAAVALAWLLAGPTARGVWYFTAGGGPDRGVFTLEGGGAGRRWKVAREREALASMVYREVERRAGGGPAVIVVADYVFHPLNFVRAWRGGAVDLADASKRAFAPRAGVRYGFVRWSEGLFAPGFTPAHMPEDDRRLGALMRSSAFTGLRRVRVFTQPNGAPLAELWMASGR